MSNENGTQHVNGTAVDDTDEQQEQALMVAVVDGKLIIQFQESVSSIALDIEQARGLAAVLLDASGAIDRDNAVRDLQGDEAAKANVEMPKTMADAWNLMDLVLPTGASPAQRRALRHAFYTGAHAMFGLMMTATNADDSEDAIALRVAALERECIEHARRIVTQRANEQVAAMGGGG